MMRLLYLWLSLLWMLVCGSALSQDYPAKPIRLVVAFTTGGATDVLARLIGKALSDQWGQPVIVDNRPGGGGNIGSAMVAKAAPDGYTLLFVPSSFGSNQSLYGKLPYDTLKDFAGVSWVARGEGVLAVHPSLGVETLKDLIALARAKPGQLNYASSGIGSSPHLRAELLKSATGIDIVHVTYKGNTPALNDLLAGHVSIAFTDLFQVVPHAKSGRLKILGVIGERRSQHLPAVPTLSEGGVAGFETGMWQGVVAPTATPRDIVRKLSAEIVKVVRTQDMKERMDKIGFEPVGSTPEQFDAHIRAEVQKWAKVIRDARIALSE
jgi:tripartite-type tricarboxylate transporter receptor subunit TctC